MDDAITDMIPDYLQQLLKSTVDCSVQDNVPNLNDENQALFEEILKTHWSLVASNNKLEKNKEERPEVEQHLQTVKETNQNIMALIKVKESEQEIGNHLKALEEGKKGHLAQNSAKITKELQTFTYREQKLKERIFKAKQNLEDFRLQKNWDQKTTEDFLKESAQEHEHIMALTKYAHQDKVRIKSLTLAIEKESVVVHEQREALNKAMAENKFSLITLDKATENVQKTLIENQQLADRWEKTVRQIAQQDPETQKWEKVLSQTRQEIREKMSSIDEFKHRLDTQRNKNKGMAKSSTIAKQLAITLKQQLETEKGNCQMLQLELQTCVNELDGAITEEKSLRAGISQMKKKIEENNDRLTQADNDNTALEGRLRAVTQTTLSQEESAAQMEQFLKDEEQDIKDLEVSLLAGKEELTFNKKHLEDVKVRKKSLTLEVSECKSHIKIMGENTKKQEEEQRRLEMILFKLDSKMRILKNALARLQGNMSLDENEILERKVAKLTKELEEKEKSANSLKNALKGCEVTNRILNKEKEKLEAKKADLINKKKTLFSLNDLKEKDLVSLRLMNQEKHVITQITKTETQRLSDFVHNRTKSVHSSQMKKLNLQRTMKEREMEMTAQKQILSRQLHITNQERHKLMLQLNEKLQKVDIMKNRCEILVACIEPEMNPEQAQAYYILKFEQEKEELRQQRDALDAKFQKTALENKALEKTNQLWLNRTSSLRQNLNQINETGPGYLEKLRLEEQLKIVQDVLMSMRRKMQELQADIQEKEEVLGSVQQAQQEVKEDTEFKERLIAKLEKSECSHQERNNRHNKQCLKLTKELRKAKSTQEETLEEKDIRLRCSREFSRKIDKMLTEIMESSPDLTSALERHFLEANVPLPTLT